MRVGEEKICAPGLQGELAEERGKMDKGARSRRGGSQVE